MRGPEALRRFTPHNIELIMKLTRIVAAGAMALCTASSFANERLFTYSYEPETMPKGAWEIEQWFTLRAGRNSTVGQKAYNRGEFRTEAEYGVTDNYTVSLYVNESYTTFKEPGTGRRTRDLCWDGISIENRYM